MKKLNPALKTVVTVVTWMIISITFCNFACAYEYPRLYRGIRPLGMGDAFTAVADDHNAIFYNPAGLSYIDGFRFKIVDPYLAVSENSIDLFSDLQDKDLNDTQEVADLLRQYVGESHHLNFGLSPYIGFKVGETGTMFRFLENATLNANVRNPIWPELHADVDIDTGLLAGFGLPLNMIPNMKAGIAVKFIHRESLNEIYTPVELAANNLEDIIDNDRKSGNGLAVDLGILYQPVLISGFETSFAVVAQNIPKMEFGDAKDVQSQLNLGLAVKKQIAGFVLIGAFDIQDFFRSVGEDDDWPKRLHMGVELQFPALVSARVGLNQGYFTAGATLALGRLVSFDIATYTEELGAYAGQQDNRRYVGQICLGWF